MSVRPVVSVVALFAALPAFAAPAAATDAPPLDAALTAVGSAVPASAAPADFWGEVVFDTPVEASIVLTAEPLEPLGAPLAAPPSASSFLAVSADIGVHTAYAWRGLNVFSAGGQQDVAGLLAPTFEVGFGDSGVAVGWFGALQLNGANAAELVDRGIGAENDVYVTWSRAFGPVEVSAGATAMMYPLADPAAAGAALPTVLEPAASVAWSGPVDVGAQVVYSAALQPELGLAPYAYLRLSGGKTVDIGGVVGLTAAAGVGYKAFPVPDAPTDNVWDVSVDLTAERALGEHLYVAPGVHGVWTNFAGRSFAESAFVWGGLNLGGSWG